MRDIIKFTVKDVDGEMKIRDYLTKRLGFSTSLIAKVKYDNVFLCGNIVHMRALVKNGDIIEINLPNDCSENITPIDIPIEILYEDDWILAVNKPRNMPVHPSRGNTLPTLANCIMSYFNSKIVFRALTRLDRDTSGIVLIAKNQLSAAILSKAQKANEIYREYYAVVEGTPDKNGVINAPIEREKEGSIKRIVRSDGKESVTKYEYLFTYNDNSSLCKVIPVTGRTHQIRVHMSYIGHPLKNDFLYGTKSEKETYRLHCSKISFPHPLTKQTLVIEAKADFLNG